MKGLIIENITNKYTIKTDIDKFICDARGKFKKDDIVPVVGDWVEFEIIDTDKKTGVIEKILERKNYIKRPKLSNITQLVFVVSSKMPKPDLLMLDKQLAFAEYMNIKPIIVANKIDLDDKKSANEIKDVYGKIGYKVIETNAKENIGVDELKNELKNNISAFSGNSGVGKSTLLNDIFGEEITEEGVVSSKNKRGKNTTTYIRLYELEENTYIADTPGFSTFDIYEIPANDICKYFREFNLYMHDCEFIGCNHIKERKCGIKEAVEEGKINRDRYERFIKIYEEVKDKEDHKW